MMEINTSIGKITLKPAEWPPSLYSLGYNDRNKEVAELKEKISGLEKLLHAEQVRANSLDQMLTERLNR